MTLEADNPLLPSLFGLFLFFYVSSPKLLLLKVKKFIHCKAVVLLKFILFIIFKSYFILFF